MKLAFMVIFHGHGKFHFRDVTEGCFSSIIDRCTLLHRRTLGAPLAVATCTNNISRASLLFFDELSSSWVFFRCSSANKIFIALLPLCTWLKCKADVPLAGVFLLLNFLLDFDLTVFFWFTITFFKLCLFSPPQEYIDDHPSHSHSN